MQHLLNADGGDLLVVAVPFDLDDDAPRGSADGEASQRRGESRSPDDVADDGGGRESPTQSRSLQLGSGRAVESAGKLDVSRLHGRGTIARVRQLTRVAKVMLGLTKSCANRWSCLLCPMAHASTCVLVHLVGPVRTCLLRRMTVAHSFTYAGVLLVECMRRAASGFCS